MLGGTQETEHHSYNLNLGLPSLLSVRCHNTGLIGQSTVCQEVSLWERVTDEPEQDTASPLPASLVLGSGNPPPSLT